MCFVTVPHPLGMISKEEVNAKVDAAFDDIVKAATAWTPSKEKQDAQVKPYPAKRFKFSGTYADVNDMFQKRKWSLSLPIVPPTVDKVAAMLKGTKRNPAEVLWVVPPRQGMLTVELVAALGVMAGAKPEHMPLLIATVEAMADPVAAWRGPTTTTAATVPPTEPREVLPRLQEQYEKNPDLAGWLTIPGTRIDYPVMYSPDEPERYLHANFEVSYSFAGLPFIDAACDPESGNRIIYAHNMLDGSMFRTLLKYQQKDFWQRNPVISFSTLYEEQEYEVVAAFYDKVYKKSDTNFKFYQFYDTSDQSSFDEAMAYYREHALYDTGVTAQCGDLFLTLVTCAYQTENGRFVVVARKK